MHVPNYHRFSLQLALLFVYGIVFFLVTSAEAETDRGASGSVQDLGDCRELVKECFSYKGDVRSHCFYTAGSHAFCKGSPLGKLAMNRWVLSGRPFELQDAPALLGPDIIDQTCLDNFDNLLSGDLIKKNPSPSEVKNLSSQLEKCQPPFEMQLDLTRP